MAKLTASVRPIGFSGSFESFRGEYRTRAHRLLAELRTVAAEVCAFWPTDVADSITDESKHPELWQKCEHRDLLSDMVRMHSAMATEGFLNFYGTYRLGQKVFDDYYERLGLVPKLRGLLLFCDQINVPKDHALVLHLDRVAQSRNALVHPKTREVTSGAGVPTALAIPGEAEAAISAMEGFFSEFALAVPGSTVLLSHSDA